jgi:hypothetical protein
MPLERCSPRLRALSPLEQYPGAGVEVWGWRRRLLGNQSRDVGKGLELEELPGVVQRSVRLAVGGNALVERERVIGDLYCRSLLAGPSLG